MVDKMLNNNFNIIKLFFVLIFLYPLYFFGSDCSHNISLGLQSSTIQNPIYNNTITSEFLPFYKGSVSNSLASSIFKQVISATENTSSTKLSKSIIFEKYIPESLKYFSTALKDSESLQGASLEQPRHLYFDPIEMLILGFNSYHTQKGSYSQEFLGLGENNNLEFSEIITRSDFDLYYSSKQTTKEWSIKSLGFTEDEIEFFNEDILVSKANPQKCISCHFAIVEAKALPAFIWEPYSTWDKAIGSNDDNIPEHEREIIDRLYSKNSNLTKLGFNKPKYYKSFSDRNFLNMPNSQLTFLLSSMQVKYLSEFYEHQSSFFSYLTYSMLFLQVYGESEYLKLLESIISTDEYIDLLLSLSHFNQFKFSSKQYNEGLTPLTKLDPKIKSNLQDEWLLFSEYESAYDLARVPDKPVIGNSLRGALHYELLKNTIFSDPILSNYSNHWDIDKLSELYDSLVRKHYSEFPLSFFAPQSNPYDVAFEIIEISSSVFPDFSSSISSSDKAYFLQKVKTEIKIFLSSPEWKSLTQN